MRYIQNPVTLELVPATEYDSSPRAAYVIGDIQPYKSMATGEIVGGRRQHREHLKQHRLIEVGNEIKSHISQARPPTPDRAGIRNALIESVRRHIR